MAKKPVWWKDKERLDQLAQEGFEKAVVWFNVNRIGVQSLGDGRYKRNCPVAVYGNDSIKDCDSVHCVLAEFEAEIVTSHHVVRVDSATDGDWSALTWVLVVKVDRDYLSALSKRLTRRWDVESEDEVESEEEDSWDEECELGEEDD